MSKHSREGVVGETVGVPTIKIEVLDKPDLQRVKMSCDGVINEKLLKYPMIQEAFSTTSFNIICGKMGQGKTSLLTSLVKGVFKKCFETIYVFMPSNSRESIENDIYGKNLPPNQLFDTLTLDNLSQVYSEIQDNSKEKYNSLIIIDDFQVSLKDPEIIKVLQKIITKMRHYGLLFSYYNKIFRLYKNRSGN